MPITSKFVCHNGHFVKEEELCISGSNRAFKYGDGFFETMHYAYGEVQLFEKHTTRMQLAMEALQITSDILSSPKLLHKEIVHLINANHYFKGARIRLSIYRSGGGLYLPETNKAEYLIECYALENDRYPINSQGLCIEIYKTYKKPKYQNFTFKTLNTPISVLASIYKKEMNVDDCLLLNEDNEIIESTHSNIFFIKDDKVLMPSLKSGCVNGLMQAEVYQLLCKTNLKVLTNQSVFEQDLTNFDEIFLTNAVKGLQWVGAYKNKRYDNKISKQIHKNLVQHIFDR